VDVKSLAKFLSFNMAGHILHSLFWGNLKPVSGDVEEMDDMNNLCSRIKQEFGSVERFKEDTRLGRGRQKIRTNNRVRKIKRKKKERSRRIS